MKSPCILGIAALVLASFVSAFGQSKSEGIKGGSVSAPEQRAQMRAKNLVPVLKLTEEQRQKIYPILLEKEKYLAGLSITERAKMDYWQITRANYEKMKTVLTPEQYQKLMDMVDAWERASKGRQGRERK